MSWLGALKNSSKSEPTEPKVSPRTAKRNKLQQERLQRAQQRERLRKQIKAAQEAQEAANLAESELLAIDPFSDKSAARFCQDPRLALQQWPQIVATKWPQKSTPPVSRIVGLICSMFVKQTNKPQKWPQICAKEWRLKATLLASRIVRMILHKQNHCTSKLINGVAQLFLTRTAIV